MPIAKVSFDSALIGKCNKLISGTELESAADAREREREIAQMIAENDEEDDGMDEL